MSRPRLLEPETSTTGKAAGEKVSFTSARSGSQEAVVVEAA